MSKRKAKQQPQLIDPDAPLTLKTAGGASFVALPNVSEQSETAKHAIKRRTPRDLGISPQKANPIMVVVAYELYGFDDHSICEVTSLNQQQLNDIRNIQQYELIKQDILQAVQNTNKDEVINKLQGHAIQAAEVYINGLSADRHQIAMQAADRVLGTLGYSGKDDSARSEKAPGLTIVFNTKEASDSITIEGMADNGRNH